MDTIASRYAKALIELAKENDKVEIYQKQIKYVHSVIKENKELVEFLKCFTIEPSNKKDLLNKIFRNDLDLEVMHFLFLIIDKKRINYLEKIFIEFNSECNEYRNILEGIIYSCDSLDETQINKIEESVALKLNKKVELSNIIDTSLIGGIKVVVNDTVFDNSIANKMQSLKQELLNRKDVR